MSINKKITMNHLSTYAGQKGIIKKVDDDGTGFLIQLENGLTLKAPAELVTFDN